jgi:hypothetical protein
MKKYISFVLGLIITSTLLIPLEASALELGTLDLTNVTPETVTAFFKPALSELAQKKVAIKILTPTYIPSSKKGTLYSIIFTDLALPERTDFYQICLNYKPEAEFPIDCQYIIFGAEKFGYKYPSGRVDIYPLPVVLAGVKEDYPSTNLPKSQRPSWVTLANGKKAVFYSAPYRNTVWLLWDDSGVRYTISIAEGTKDQALKIVNSIYKQ